MKALKHISAIIIAAAAVVVAVTSCSTQKNTAGSRWWHSFNAKYNTYYNGSLAYIDGSLEKENGNKDNFTEIIPLYTVGNKNSRELGKSNFDRAIQKAQKAIQRHSIKKRPEWTKNRRKTEKDIEWLSRREYNPFLWKCWMLMGRSQFHQGEFEEAASTFAYMSRLYKTQPAIYGKARAWLAKCYIEEDWMYDAEDVIRNMKRDSLDWRAVKEWDYTYADYYLHTHEYEKAIPYLRRVIKHEMRRKQKAREWYLMGQIQAALGHKQEAYKAFKRVIRMNPPYELEFNARIAMTEVLATGQSRKMVNRLKRMAASDKNKDYLDQVYYAMGNIYLADKDTTSAISAYEQGNKKATRSGIEKGVLLLHLGDLYWQQEKYSDARRCYGEAIGLLDKDRPDYEQLSNRSKVLDKLVPFTDAVHLQDSLQYLAKCPEEERNEAIDRVIEQLKEKEKAEKDAQAEQNGQQAQEQGSAFGTNNQTSQRRQTQANRQQNGTWYFYNQMAINQGKEAFQRQWGRRENVDNWQRINKTVVGQIGSMANPDELTDSQRDSIFQADQKQDSLEQISDSAQNDPHKREYYLAQLPFTPEQVDASNKILEDGLHHAGVIFKDDLDNLPLAEKNLRRLSDNYPDYEHMDEVFYHLYLLYMRKGEESTANNYLDSLKTRYPESQLTATLTDPYFVENSKFGVHMEDSLYAATYDAFKQGRYGIVDANARVSESRFPMGANRDKFLFVGGLTKLNEGNATGCVNDMKRLVKDYPQSGLSEMAGMIVNGVNAGRRLHGGRFDLGDMWSRRTDVLNDSDSIRQQKFSPDRNIDFKVMLVYAPDSLNENKLLFEMARFNFTNFLVRNFAIEISDDEGLHQMRVSGFRSYDEAYQYARQLLENKNILMQMNNQARLIIISDKNLEMIGVQFSYNDYDDFYKKHFAPLRVTTRYLLSEPAEVASPRERDIDEEISSKAPTQGDIDAQQQSEQPADTGFDIALPAEPEKPAEQPSQDEGGIVVPTTPTNDSNAEAPADGLTIPDTDQQENQKPADTSTTVVPAEPETPEEPATTNDNIFEIPSDDNAGGTDNGIYTLPEEKPAEPVQTEQPKTTKTPATTEEPTTAKPVTAEPETTTKTAQPAKKPTKPEAKSAQPEKKPEPDYIEEAPIDDTGIYFDDGFGNAPQEDDSNTNAPTDDNIDDEYYDLDGF